MSYNPLASLLTKSTQQTASLEDLLSELESKLDGKQPFFYALEGVSYSESDSIYLPYWWSSIEYVRRAFDANAQIIHTGVQWQATNQIDEETAKKASNK